MKKKLKIILVIICLIAIAIPIFMQRKTFGVHPSGERLKKIQQSANYKDDSFVNLSPTEVMLKESSYFQLFKDFLNKPKTNEPPSPIPSLKTDLRTLGKNTPSVVWFGHSSYLISANGKNILVDPVFSGYASPVSFAGKSFAGANVYGVNDMPEIDMLVITHDHYDHLDYETINKIHSKVKKFYTSLGVGAHLEYWGIDAKKIVELDWWESHKVSDQIEITATPARHFSGRGIRRGKTLWSSFVLNLGSHKIFIGGDSGYDTHFKTIGEKFGGFDLALLEAGQYGTSWPLIHMFPEQTVSASQDLKAKVLFPVHWGKFALAYHEWNEPIKKVFQTAKAQNVSLTTPLIGEPVLLDSVYPQKVWWEF